MRFKKQSLNELLDQGASLIIDDELTVEELIELTKKTKKYNDKIDKNKETEKKEINDKDIRIKRYITILARNKGLEDLKRIVSVGKGCVTIDVSER